MKKAISFLLITAMILIACVACSKEEEVETYTVTIYSSLVNSHGIANTHKKETRTVKDGDIIGQIEKGNVSYLYEFKGFFTEKTAVKGQEWNPAKDEVHSDLNIYVVWEFKD